MFPWSRVTLKNLENRFLRRVHCSLIEKIMPFNIIVVDREILTTFRECFYGRAFLRRRLFMLLNPEEEGEAQFVHANFHYVGSRGCSLHSVKKLGLYLSVVVSWDNANITWIELWEGFHLTNRKIKYLQLLRSYYIVEWYNCGNMYFL